MEGPFRHLDEDTQLKWVTHVVTHFLLPFIHAILIILQSCSPHFLVPNYVLKDETFNSMYSAWTSIFYRADMVCVILSLVLAVLVLNNVTKIEYRQGVISKIPLFNPIRLEKLAYDNK